MALRAEESALRAQLDGYIDDAAGGKIDRVFASKVVAKLNAKITEATPDRAAVTPPALAGLLSGDPGEDVESAGTVPQSRRSARC